VCLTRAPSATLPRPRYAQLPRLAKRFLFLFVRIMYLEHEDMSSYTA
jgi:hypothetical protein